MLNDHKPILSKTWRKAKSELAPVHASPGIPELCEVPSLAFNKELLHLRFRNGQAELAIQRN